MTAEKTRSVKENITHEDKTYKLKQEMTELNSKTKTMIILILFPPCIIT